MKMKAGHLDGHILRSHLIVRPNHRIDILGKIIQRVVLPDGSTGHQYGGDGSNGQEFVHNLVG